MLALDRCFTLVVLLQLGFREAVERTIPAVIIDLSDANDWTIIFDLSDASHEILKGLPSDGVQCKVLVRSL